MLKQVIVSVTFAFSLIWHLGLPHPWQPTLLLVGCNLDLTMESFIFLALPYDTIGGGEKTSTSLSP